MILMIAVAIGIIVSTAGNVSQYATFSEAVEMASRGNVKKVHVIGELTRDNKNQIMNIEYTPWIDPNYIAFSLTDREKNTQKVICYNPPASIPDFRKSEKIVIIGSVKNKQFIANEILMKCPSKYENKEINY